jgi:hypothetical protein
MPSAQAQAHNPEDDVTAERAVPPLHLGDVDDLLLQSARAARVGSDVPVRAWRDELTEALAVLTYAETVLAGDAALLHHCLATGPFDHKQVLDGLARAVAGDDVPDAVRPGLTDDDAVFARADRLLSVHERMASADLTRRQVVRRLLDDVECELVEVAARRLQVDARLANIRAAVIRQYREGNVPAPESWLR